MGARLTIHSERFGKSYYLHYGADNDTFETIKEIVKVEDEKVFTEAVNKLMSTTHKPAEYTEDIDVNSERYVKMFRFANTDEEMIESGMLRDTYKDKVIPTDMVENLMSTNDLFIGKSGHVFHTGTAYNTLNTGYITTTYEDVLLKLGKTDFNVGYAGDIENITLHNEFAVTIK